jgi:hypothetical protein
MSELRLYLPIGKVDEARRLVFGVLTADQRYPSSLCIREWPPARCPPSSRSLGEGGSFRILQAEAGCSSDRRSCIAYSIERA